MNDYPKDTVYTNRQDIKQFCQDNGVPFDSFSSEEMVTFHLEGQYIFVRSGGFWQKVEDIESLQRALLG